MAFMLTKHEHLVFSVQHRHSLTGVKCLAVDEHERLISLRTQHEGCFPWVERAVFCHLTEFLHCCSISGSRMFTSHSSICYRKSNFIGESWSESWNEWLANPNTHLMLVKLGSGFQLPYNLVWSSGNIATEFLSHSFRDKGKFSWSF